jgi:hypothetical protein
VAERNREYEFASKESQKALAAWRVAQQRLEELVGEAERLEAELENGTNGAP